MKKLATIATAAIVMLFATTASAAEITKVSNTVKTAFTKDFSEAKNISWEKEGRFYYAEFKINEKRVSAAYNENGELVATLRKIELSQLPAVVASSIKSAYKGFALGSVVTEVTYQGETFYRVSVSNGKKVLHLKCDSTGDISVESRQK